MVAAVAVQAAKRYSTFELPGWIASIWAYLDGMLVVLANLLVLGLACTLVVWACILPIRSLKKRRKARREAKAKAKAKHAAP